MTEREALNLALEALKYPLNQSHENFNVDMAELLAYRAITAIKEALAQPEQEPVAFVKGCNRGQWEIFPAKAYQIFEREQPLYTTPPQPWEKFCDSNCVWTDHHPDCKLAEQESVTWRNAAIRVGEDLCSVGPFGYYDMTAEQWLDWALSVVTVHAPPPQRKPLTDEEFRAILRSLSRQQGWDGDGWDLALKEAIEAAHGIGCETTLVKGEA